MKTEMHKSKGFTTLEIVLLVIVFGGIVAGAYYWGVRSASKTQTNETQKQTKSTVPTQYPTDRHADPLFSGTINKLSNDLGLFKISDSDKENGVPESLVYYEAGTFLSGELKGYKRVLAIRPSEGPGPSLQFMLATTDYISYVLDDPLSKTINYPESDWDNPYMYLDKGKISRITTFDSSHPVTISVESPFKLIRRESVLLENKKTGGKDKNGNDIYQEVPISTFQTEQKLTAEIDNLTLYAGGTDWSNGKPQNAKEQADQATREKYLKSSTLVHAVDSVGITYSYILSTERDVNAYIASRAQDEKKYIEYKKQVELYTNKKIKEYPESPVSHPFPGLRLSRATEGLGADFYSSYDSAFPGACGGNLSTYVVDGIQESDLVPVNSSSVYPLFVLKTAQHPLTTLLYHTKTDQGEESFKAVNKGMTIPLLAEYDKKHPLIFAKDAWGRFVVLGEFDLQLMGGCGKPVVYLYPEKPTEVHLSFATPMTLNINIPTYTKGWFVKANPNGLLTDLQPEFTNCKALDSSHVGSEYAASACNNNTYPYIYWSGKNEVQPYPTVDGGWVVEKNQLKLFLKEKLSVLGFTDSEAADMIEYWVTKMSKQNKPYYRLSFIQTQDMNAFVPMRITPQPDSVLRVFLDWQGLQEKPIKPIMPQELRPFVRRGFSYVEWGGLLE